MSRYQNPEAVYGGHDPEACDAADDASACECCGERTLFVDVELALFICSPGCRAAVVAAGEAS